MTDFFEVRCRRYKVLMIDPDILIRLGMVEGIETTGKPMPPDAKVVHRYFDERGHLGLVVESESFPEVPPGSFPAFFEGLRFRQQIFASSTLR